VGSRTSREERPSRELRVKKKFSQVYQFMIALEAIWPPIWRRIQVPATYTFWDLHVAIADAMGWQDYHLHEFEMADPNTGDKVIIGIPDEEFLDDERVVLPDDRQRIARYFTPDNNRARYIYDFGDGWQHRIELEKIVPREENVKYPSCLAGKRACPPEDCGGFGGYGRLLEALADPDDEEHEDLLIWAGAEFDPEVFDPAAIVFVDPVVRRRLAFG